MVDGDAAGREDRRAVGELVFVAGGRGSSGTPRGGSRMARTSGGVGMMPGPDDRPALDHAHDRRVPDAARGAAER